MRKVISKQFSSGVYAPGKRPRRGGLPGRSDCVGFFRDDGSGMTDSIGLSFTGTFPDVTMTISTGCPLIGVGDFADGGSYLLSALPHNIGNQFFWGDRGIAIYNAAQTDAISKRALRYLSESWWPQGLVFANDVFTPANNRGQEMQLSYAGGVADGNGGLTTDAPVHAGKGLWNGPAFTNNILSTSNYVLGSEAIESNLLESGWRELMLTDAAGAYSYLTLQAGSTLVRKTFTATLMAGSGLKGDRVDLWFYDLTTAEYIPSSVEIIDGPGTAALEPANRTRVAGLSTIEATHIKVTTDAATVNANTAVLIYPGSVETGDAGTSLLIKDAIITDSIYKCPYIPPATTSASAAATSAGNGPSVEMDEQMLRVLRGAPDGVELCGNSSFDDDTWWSGSGSAGRLITGGEATFTVAAVGVGFYRPGAVSVGERYQITYTVKSISTGAVKLIVPFEGKTRTSPGTYTETGVATSDTISIGATVSDLTGSIDGVSIQKLTPAVGTIAVETYMGVGSDELETSQFENVVSFADSRIKGPFFEKSASDVDYIVKLTDGVNWPALNVIWNRDEIHRRVVQVASTTFRIGIRRFASDGITPTTAWQWSHTGDSSTWATFDGSFDPLEFLRFGYLLTVPQWHRSCHFWNRSDVTEAEIEAPFALT